MERRRADRERRVAPTGSVGSGAGHLFVSRLIVAAAGWIGTIIIARNLSPSGWGGYSFVFGLLGIVGIVVDLQVGRLVLKEVIQADDEAGRIVGSYVSLRALIGLVALVVAISVVLLGDYESQVVWATVVAGVGYLFISPANGLIAWFQARLWLRPVAVSNVLAALTQLGIVVVVAILTGGTMVQFAAAFVASQFVILVWRSRVLLRHHVHLDLRVDRARWWEWIKEAAPLTLGFALVTLYYKIDIVLLSQLDTLHAVGQYWIGYKFADLASALSLTFLTPLMTVMVAAWPHDVGALHRYYRQAATVLLLAGTLLTVGFALVAVPLVDLLYGAEYAPSVSAARFLMLGATLQFFSYLCYVTLVAVGRNRPYAIAGIVGVIVNVALNLVLIPHHSFRGSAVATVITEVLVLVVLVTALTRTPGIVSIPWRVVVSLAVAASGMAVTYLALERVLPWPVAGAAAVAAFAGLLHVSGAEEPGGLRAFVRTVRFDARIDAGGLPPSETTG